MTLPTSAYDLLDEHERAVVDEYMLYLRNEQNMRKERIAVAIEYPINPEYLKRSRGLLARPLVRAALAEKIRAAGEEQDLSPSRVIKEHATIAFSNIADYYESRGFGEVHIKDLTKIPRELMAAVKTIRTKPTMYGNHMEIVMHDKKESLKVFGELMGLVAPDRPPALEDYTKDSITARALQDAPEAIYAELLSD